MRKGDFKIHSYDPRPSMPTRFSLCVFVVQLYIFFFFYQQVSSGEIAPFSLVQVEVVFNPTKSGNALAEFEISFSDPLSPPVSESFVRNTVLLG